MALRVSRQLVEILSKGEGVLRVSRQLVEILAKADIGYAENSITIVDVASYTNSRIAVSASNTLTIVQIANTADASIDLEASNSITIIDTATFQGTIVVNASNTLNILSIADNIDKARDATNEITITDVASYTIVGFNLSIFDPITITQIASFTGPKYVSASNSITITDTANAQGTINVSASNSLIITETTLDEDTATWSTTSTGIEQIASYESIQNRNIYHYVPVTDEAKAYVSHPLKWISKSASNSITIVDHAVLSTVLDITDSITIVSTANFLIVNAASNTITITDSATLTKVLNLEASNTLVIEQAHSYSLIRQDTLCTYSPFIGNSSSISVLPPRPTTPTIVNYDNIELTYPVIGTTDTLTLRGPELGNRNNLQYQRINRESRGGTLTIFADPIWPKIETMILEFHGLSETESQTVLAFISTTLGQMIRIRDWEGRIWVGSIITPDEPIIRNGKGCSNSLSLTIDVDSTYSWHTYDGFDWDAFIGDDWDIFLGE